MIQNGSKVSQPSIAVNDIPKLFRIIIKMDQVLDHPFKLFS